MKNGEYTLIIPPADYPGKRYRGRYAYEHTVVYWQNTGQITTKGFNIHHINGDKRDNRFANLELITEAEHKKHHRSELNTKIYGETKVELKCVACGNLFVVQKSRYKSRCKQGTKNFYCSRQCYKGNSRRGVLVTTA